MVYLKPVLPLSQGNDSHISSIYTCLLNYFYSAGGTQRLPRLIGIPKAKELIYTAAVLDAKKAHEFGIVNHASESAFDKALEIAESILPQGPVAVCMAKSAIDRGAHLDM